MATPAHIIFISNPFKPFEDTATEVLPCDFNSRRYTIRKYLRKKFGKKFRDFDRPTLCLLNGRPVMRRHWGRKIRPNDVINFVALAGGPVAAVYLIIAALVVVATVVALTVKLPTPNSTGDQAQPDPVYSLKGQRNQVRLGMPIESSYGTTRLWPSYAAPAYNQYIDNKQWLFQLFSLGQGSRSVSAISIDDTPIADYQNVNWEIVAPGDAVTLFPTNVKTSSEVGGIELLGTNQGALDGTDVVDSEGDGAVTPPIAATDHPAASSAGPFVANDTGTQTNRLEVDVQLPRGLYKQNDDGTLVNQTITALFEYQLIDNAGGPLGAWTTLYALSLTKNTVDPQRYTYGLDVTLGRYRVRASRTNVKDTSDRVGNTLIWESLRCFLPSSNTFPGVTILAVKAQATNNLSEDAATKINCISTRLLPKWDPTLLSGVGDWSTTLYATRSPVWAAADILRSTYGGRLAAKFIKQDTFVELDLICADRDEFFDWQFEQKTTIWDALRVVALVARSIPMLEGSRVTLIRDDPKSFPTAIFNPENIVKGSWKWDIKLAASDDNDGLLVTYTDPDSWKEETVPCNLDDEDGNNPATVKFAGITGRDHAYRLGMYQRSVQRYRREAITFDTGLEGHIPSYGDMIGVSYDVPRWSNGGRMLSMTKTSVAGPLWQYQFTVSETFATFTAGTRSLILRDSLGDTFGPLTIGWISANVLFTNLSPDDPLIALLDALDFDQNRERPIYLFGTPDIIGKNLCVTSLAPSDEENVQVVGAPYDDRLYEFDDATAPAIGETHGHLPDKVSLPAVSGLRVVRAPIDEVDGGTDVFASWHAMRGADFYRVEKSYDAVVWERVTETRDLNARFGVTARYLYVRVAAVNDAQGDWAYWTGEAPIWDTGTATPPSGLTLSSSGQGIIQTDGTYVARLKAAWTISADLLVKANGFYRIQYKRTVDSDYSDWGTVAGLQAFDYITDVKIGTAYDVRVRAENKFGGFSSWITPGAGSHTVVGDQTVPTAAGSVVATAFPGYNEITWSRSATPQVNEYQIWRNTSNSFSGATKIGEDDSLVFDDSGVVGGLSAGTTYYYFIVPVSGSNVSGTTSASASCVTLTAPVGAATPSTPSAPTYQGGGTFIDANGTPYAYATVRIQGLPANGVWQNILLRRHGGTSDWQIYSQNKNTTSNFDVRIDDLVPGADYDLAVQAWSGAGGSTINPITSPGYFTSATYTTAPGAPTSVVANKPSSSYPIPPVFVSGGTQCLVGRLSWLRPSSAPTVQFYEAAFTNTDTDGAADTASANNLTVRTQTEFADYAALTPAAYYGRVRTVDRAGNHSAWVNPGINLNTQMAFSAGTISGQDASAVAITGGASVTTTEQTAGMKTGAGGASSIRQIKCHYEKHDTSSLTGGSATESVSVSLTNRGFSGRPDYGQINVSSPTIGAYYDVANGANSTTNAVIIFYKYDGTNLPSGSIEYTMQFDEYF